MSSRLLAPPLLWLPAEATTICRFANVPPGRYAVAVSHDLNANGRVEDETPVVLSLKLAN